MGGGGGREGEGGGDRVKVYMQHWLSLMTTLGLTVSD